MAGSGRACPPGYGESVICNGLGQFLYRMLICESCWCLVADDATIVILHNKWHENNETTAKV